MSEQKAPEQRTWTEELELAANEVVDTVKELLHQGNVRRIIVRKPNDEVLIEIPLTAGVAVGSVMAIFTPVLAAVGALAALLTSVKIQVVRVEGGED
ncbi:MAG: DUF4342 domain-containing protein [Chloroflexi bacterium]|jgi:hypothetical protein|nr:DUF4342 domain-containing protein [Chloroflexota bacterium]